MLPYFTLRLCEVEIMEKGNKDIMVADISAMTKDDKSTDPFWPFLIIMLCFGLAPSYDSKTREELAELKGKVSVLEKLAVRGN